MQLEEMIVSMCLAMVLAGTVLQMNLRSWKYSSEAAACAQTAQQTQALRQAWRHFIRGCPERPRWVSAGELQAGTWRATVAADGLRLAAGEESQALGLPGGMTAEIGREGQPGEMELWTLNLTWPGRRSGSHTPGRTRIVACRGEVSP